MAISFGSGRPNENLGAGDYSKEFPQLALPDSRPDDDAALFVVLQRIELRAGSAKPEVLY